MGAAESTPLSEEQKALEERYAVIKAAVATQEQNYQAFLAEQGKGWGKMMEEKAASLGLKVDLATGHISYADDFPEKKLKLNFDLMYCRHGKTTGNTEPRVYQGFVDEPKNALNDVGKGQAQAAADKLDALGLSPDLVILSPLSRASDTGRAFLDRHPELSDKIESWFDSAEMKFGGWDNVRVCDLDESSIGHLFYLNQNTVVKSFEPYVNPETGEKVDGENFVECLVRMREVLEKINARFDADAEKRPLVLMYGHSMAGAALSINVGIGKTVDGSSHLGFDGKYIMPNATPVFLHREGEGDADSGSSFFDSCTVQ
eukprot:scaffold1197_cov228-Pinguiococcus_pyrenoidosus.AAC.10